MAGHERPSAPRSFPTRSVIHGLTSCETDAATLERASATLRQRTLQAELDDVAAMHTARVHLLAGTDVFYPCDAPIAGLWRELALFVRAGFSPYEALRTATVEPAAYFGRPGAGMLKLGSVADMVLIDANPFEKIEAIRHVWAVVKAGRLVGLRRSGNT
jgi:imidazolonepropionase-like amidohydrolase